MTDTNGLPLWDNAPTKPTLTLEMSKLESAAWTWRRENPGVYEACVVETRKLWRPGQPPISFQRVWENVRANYRLIAGVEKDHCGVKLNNNHRPYVQRWIMAENPECDGAFVCRSQRMQSTVGPPNKSLPSGKHRH